MRNSNNINSIRHLDSELLRTFLAIAEAGSFTKGAMRIFRSQSAASLQIKKLEELLGQPVFSRQGRGIELTSAGEDLRPVAKHVVELLDTTLAGMITPEVSGSMRIGIPDEYGETLLPQVIAEFAHNHPNVELSVQCAFSADFPEALARGELDMAVFDDERPGPNGIILKTHRTVWAASRNHLVQQKTPIPLALFDRACWWRDMALEALHHKKKPFHIIYTSESVTGVLAAVKSGVAIGLLGAQYLENGLVELTAQDGFPPMPSSHLVLRRREGADASLCDVMENALRRAFRVETA